MNMSSYSGTKVTPEAIEPGSFSYHLNNEYKTSI